MTTNPAKTDAPPPAATAAPWHAFEPAEVLGALDAAPDGLTEAEAARRLAAHGPNALPPPPRRTTLDRLLAQFDNLLIHVLVAAAVITVLLGHYLDALVILGVVVINAIVGFLQEGRAEKALDAIRDMLTPHAAVLREGRRLTIGIGELVPGDVVLLEAGDRVPADLRLFRARSLRIDEAILTGESVPVEKDTGPVAETAPIGDRSGVAFSGTLVTGGTGSGVVVATGTETELGRIGTLLGSVETLTTPLLRQMDQFARKLTYIILGVSAAVFAFALLTGGMGLSDAFIAVVGIAVAAIPEGLPAVLTITLALGVQRMAGRNAIIRRLPAVETLGAVSIICTDKTGTLTRNEMTVRSIVAPDRLYAVEGVGYDPAGGFRDPAGSVEDLSDRYDLAALAAAAMLCNDAALRRGEAGWVVDGDPMEGALIVLGMKAGYEAQALGRQFPRRDEIPFDARHRFMATLHHGHEGEAFICLKGAPEQVLALCAQERGVDGDRPIDPALWHRRVEQLAADGQRVLAVALREVPQEAGTLRFDEVEQGGFVLLGLLGLIDPPREEAITAVAECRTAGIRVKMITGDHAATAAAIAAQIGLENPGEVVTGQMLDEIDEADLPTLARRADVFARTSPEHKLRLVTALQADGTVVAMTGDGVNDAPALKRAAIGVAMGRKGTEAAKEASDMVLADDNFASIAAAVREGRTVNDNLRKAIGWTLPTNGGQAIVIVLAILLGLTLPVTPVQILWINMVTAVTLGLTLAFEPSEPGVMRRPPRRSDDGLISRFLLWRVVFVSLLFAAGGFALFFWADARGRPVEVARTIVVNAIVVMSIAYLFSIRFRSMTSLTLRGVVGTRAVLIGITTVTALQFLLTYAPFMQVVFDTRGLTLAEGLATVGVGAALLLILEGEKWISRRSARRRGALPDTATGPSAPPGTA